MLQAEKPDQGDAIRDNSVLAAIKDVSRLPARPVIYTRLCRLIESDDCSLTGVAQLVEQDLAISTKILQVANTAFFSRGSAIASVAQAVPRLGARFVRDLVLGFETYQQLAEHSGIDVEALHHEGLVVGTAARQMVSKSQAENAFLAGFVHDIGRMVLAYALPKKALEVAQRIRRTGESHEVAELAVLDISHAELGAHLLSAWGMPHEVVLAARHHHHPERAQQSEFGILTAVYVAHALYEAAMEDAEPQLDLSLLENLRVEDRLYDWVKVMRQVMRKVGQGQRTPVETDDRRNGGAKSGTR